MQILRAPHVKEKVEARLNVLNAKETGVLSSDCVQTPPDFKKMICKQLGLNYSSNLLFDGCSYTIDFDPRYDADFFRMARFLPKNAIIYMNCMNCPFS